MAQPVQCGTILSYATPDALNAFIPWRYTMSKKFLICALSLLACFAFACSDDDNEWKNGNFCNADKLDHNGTQCDGQKLIECVNSRFKITKCSDTCTVVHSKAQCSESSTPALPDDDCGSIDAYGSCLGNIANVCVNNKLVIDDCSKANKTCGKDNNGVATCLSQSIAPNPPDDKPGTDKPGTDKPGTDQNACGDITEYGVCDEGILKYCNNDKIVSETCSDACIQIAETPTSYAAAVCKQPCGNITDKGICPDANHVQYCDNENGLITLSCLNGTSCQTGPDGFVNCTANTDPCNGIDENGICDKNVALICNNGKLHENACSTGTTCGRKQDGRVDCIPDSPATGCGSITEDGTCNGNTLQYCDNNELKQEKCDSKCIIVSFEDGSSYAQCYEPCHAITEAGICSDDKSGYSYCDEEYGILSQVCAEDSLCGYDDNMFANCYPKD